MAIGFQMNSQTNSVSALGVLALFRLPSHRPLLDLTGSHRTPFCSYIWPPFGFGLSIPSFPVFLRTKFLKSVWKGTVGSSHFDIDIFVLEQLQHFRFWNRV